MEEKTKRQIWIDIQAFLVAYATMSFMAWNIQIAEWNGLERLAFVILGSFLANIMQSHWKKERKNKE